MNHWAHKLWSPYTLYRKHLSLRLSMMVASAMIILLMATLLIMFFVSRRSMTEDALQRAMQTLEGAMIKVDNIMLSVEETAGNMYYNLQPQLANPDTMYTYSRKIIEKNPCVVACAVAFRPDYYAGRGALMAYTHRNGNIHERHQDSNDSVVICKETFDIIPYSEQVWFTRTLEANKPLWLNPLEGIEAGLEPLILYCLPIRDDGGVPVGVMTLGVSISLLSETVIASRPSPNSYCAMLDRNGTFVVHPTGKYLLKANAFELQDEALQKVIKTILADGTGNTPLSLYGRDYQVFYRPFQQAVVPFRSMENLDWNIAVAMSKEDIFGEYNRYFNDIVVIAVSGMLLLLLLCWGMLYFRLMPLTMLKEKTQRIARGHYNESIPDTQNTDEIGCLQQNFVKMQRAVANNIGELEALNKTIQERSKSLKKAYRQAQKADKLKIAFLHHMSNQMLTPAKTIDEDVTALCGFDEKAGTGDAVQMVEEIQQNGNTIAELLTQLLNLSEDEMRKEVEHDDFE